MLHAFHEGAGREGRWARPRGGAQGSGGRSHPIGPVSCECLRQLVSTPFLIERTRLQYMRGFTARCVELPAGQTLAAFLEDPTAGQWRRFSFASPASRCLCGGIAASRAVSWPSDLREMTAWWSSGDGSSGAERDAASACDAR